MHKKKKSVWKKILWLIRPYLHFLMLSFVFAGISALLTLYAPILIGNAVDLIIGKGSVDFDAIGRILFRLAGIIVITSAAQWLMNLCNNHITYRVVKDVRTKAFAKLQKLPLKYVDSHAYGETISRIITDVEQFSDGLLMGFTQFFTGVVTILGTLVFMLLINVKIALVVILITPVSLFVASFIAKRTYVFFKAQSETRAQMTSLVDEMVGNQKVVQAFGYQEEAQKRFEEINSRLQGYIGIGQLFEDRIGDGLAHFGFDRLVIHVLSHVRSEVVAEDLLDGIGDRSRLRRYGIGDSGKDLVDLSRRQLIGTGDVTFTLDEILHLLLGNVLAVDQSLLDDLLHFGLQFTHGLVRSDHRLENLLDIVGSQLILGSLFDQFLNVSLGLISLSLNKFQHLIASQPIFQIRLLGIVCQPFVKLCLETAVGNERREIYPV